MDTEIGSDPAFLDSEQDPTTKHTSYDTSYLASVPDCRPDPQIDSGGPHMYVVGRLGRHKPYYQP
jgi:hypothetical protein